MEEEEEERQWEGRERTTTKRNFTGMVNDDYNEYASPHPESEAAVGLFDLKLTILFEFGPRYVELSPISRR